MSRSFAVAMLASALVVAACDTAGRSPRPEVVHLVDEFGNATFAGSPPTKAASAIEWRLEPSSIARGEQVPPGGVRGMMGAVELEVRDNRLTGRAAGPGLVAFRLPENEATGLLHSLELRLRVSAGSRLGVFLSSVENPSPADLGPALLFGGDLSKEVTPGDEIRSYTLTSADSTFAPSFSLDGLKWVLVQPSETPGATFEIESLRLVPLDQHLASIPSGVGWHGLGEIYRETIVARSPEVVRFDVDLPEQPWLDLAVGTAQAGAITFAVTVESGGGQQRELLRRTVTRPSRWEPLRLELHGRTGRATLTLALESEQPGQIGYWGAPVIRRGGAPAPAIAEPTTARAALASAAPPQGVILIIADTLRPDHLESYGYGREAAPRLAKLLEQGVVFEDTISQGAWTKVAVTSILTSLYASTHGVERTPDRIAAAVTTLAEVYREHGYATFGTSSVPFSGKLTNLHQGLEVLHESTSLEDAGLAAGAFLSKSARTLTDRLLPWLEMHRDVPFFATLHVMDPHSPYRPHPPYDRLWLDEEGVRAHQAELLAADAQIRHPLMKLMQMPSRRDLELAKLDEALFLEHEYAWYDGSIRAMDDEIGRVIERLRGLGLLERTAIAFLADHGEEFLEHGRHWHGNHAYGEMINVPMALYWKQGLPGGVRVSATVQSIDLMPTLLELSRLPIPEGAQGQSLLPLIAEPNGSAAQPLAERTIFSERKSDGDITSPDYPDTDALVAIGGGFKLIHHVRRPEGHPEHELFDHRSDPLDLKNVASEHPEEVERLLAEIAQWQKSALEAKVSDGGESEMSEEERERLRALGYIE